MNLKNTKIADTFKQVVKAAKHYNAQLNPETREIENWNSMRQKDRVDLAIYCGSVGDKIIQRGDRVVVVAGD